MLNVKVKDKEGYNYIYFPKYNLILPEEIAKKDSAFNKYIFSYFNRLKSFEKSNNVLNEEIIRKLANVRNVCLEVSEACNLRCRYCIYSGKFLDMRRHTKRLMSWKTANSAIDFYFDWIEKNRDLMHQPYIFQFGFYGGEPLLNITLIEEAIRYIKDVIKKNKNILLRKSRILYNITTNGLLLDEDIINYFKLNKVRLLISIDGPLEIQNKNKGNGTFNNVFENIKYIYKTYPDYYKKCISFSTVYATDTDIYKVRDFFAKKMFDQCVRLNIGYVNDSFSSMKFPKYGINEKMLINEIIEKKTKGTTLYKIEEALFKNYFSSMKLGVLSIKGKRNYGGYCTLGSKNVFVSVDGELHGCDKSRDSFKIGDLKEGFDIEKIAEIEAAWHTNTEKCENCFVQAICPACVAYTGVNGKIILDEYCNRLKEEFKEKIGEYIELYKSNSSK